MELRHLRYFARAAELLHFTHAAESLYISQPALSAHIHQLEEEVGAALFDRTGRKIVLTDAGQIFYDHARLALDKLLLIPIVKPEIIIDFGILWPKSAELSPAARAFLDHVFGQLSAPV